MPELARWVIVTIVVATPVALVVRYFLFRLGCVLADLAEPSLGKSILAFVIAMVVTVPLGVGAGIFLAILDAQYPKLQGYVLYPGLAVDLAVCWLLAAVVYWLVLSISYTKGLMVAGIELLLSVLAAGLAAALFMVIGAGVQILQRPTSQSELPQRLTLPSKHIEHS